MEAKDRIIVALDVSDAGKALELVQELKPHVGCFKIGLQFINAMLASIIVPRSGGEVAVNVAAIRKLFAELDGNVLWDGKFDDIPNTVGGASKEIAKMRLKMFNLHASAGREAIAKAVANKGSSLVFGVTVLTSIDESECKSIFGGSPDNMVFRFASMLVEAEADGIICSAKELKLICSNPTLSDLLKVTPGIRPEWAQTGDQKRVMAPGEAIKAGADYLVIGRPIRQPPSEIGSPADAAQKIAEEIEEALAEGGE